MPLLSEIQGAFARAALDAGAEVPPGVTCHLRKRPQKRFGVYRNNIYSNLIDVLQSRFPAVARLVGEEFFRAAARVFIERHPPASPVLMRYGAAFAGFLDGFEPAAGLPYLGDVARLEWAWAQAYHAADAAPLGAEALRGIAPDEAGGLIVTLHPSVQVVRSPWPVVTIWSANTGEGEPGPIDAGAAGEDALVVRPELSVEVRRLPEGGAAFLEALGEGKCLEDAATRALVETPEFDLQANLTGLLQCGAVTGLRQAGGRGDATDA